MSPKQLYSGGNGFWVQTRRERRAYPSGICRERTTKSEPKRHVALRVAPLLGSGFVAPRSQPRFGGCSLVAPRQNQKSAQPAYKYFRDTTLKSSNIYLAEPLCQCLLVTTSLK